MTTHNTDIETLKAREDAWLKIRAFIKQEFGKAPNMEGMLFLIGMNVLGGNFKKEFTKEDKENLMHIAVCHLLMPFGYYKFEHIDADGWPHYSLVKPLPVADLMQQEDILKDAVIHYFREAGVI